MNVVLMVTLPSVVDECCCVYGHVPTVVDECCCVYGHVSTVVDECSSRGGLVVNCSQ